MQKEISEKHSILIDGQLYEELKKFCQLNNFKLTSYVDHLLRDAFMIDKYGDAPFVNYKKELTHQPIKQINVVEPVQVEKESDEAEIQGINKFTVGMELKEPIKDNKALNNNNGQPLSNKPTNNRPRKRTLK